jgi:hypothetical protein
VKGADKEAMAKGEREGRGIESRKELQEGERGGVWYKDE